MRPNLTSLPTVFSHVAGLNRLLTNNSYEAAFPIHEVITSAFLCGSSCRSLPPPVFRSLLLAPFNMFRIFLCLNRTRVATTAKTPSRPTEQRTRGTSCMNAGPGGGSGTSTSRWTSSGEQTATVCFILRLKERDATIQCNPYLG